MQVTLSTNAQLRVPCQTAAAALTVATFTVCLTLISGQLQSAVLPSWQRSGAAPEAGAALTRSNSAPDMRLLLGGFSGQTLPSMQSLPPFGSASTGNALAPYLAPEVSCSC